MHTLSERENNRHPLFYSFGVAKKCAPFRRHSTVSSFFAWKMCEIENE